MRQTDKLNELSVINAEKIADIRELRTLTIVEKDALIAH